jgi:hypothetical protein
MKTGLKKLINLSGRRFCRLVVLGPHESRKNKVHWLCRCDCGNETWVNSQSLRDGGTKSCGCLQREAISRRFLKDISGQRFGRLLVLGPVERRRQVVYWLCKCECGVEKFVSAPALRSGSTRSCGCWNREASIKRSQRLKKRYRVILKTEQRKTFEEIIQQRKDSSNDVLKARIILLADESSQGAGWSDKRIATELNISRFKVEHARMLFVAPDELKRRMRNGVERTRTDPKARLLRLEASRRYDQKPEKKELKRQYTRNLPPEVRARKLARARVYRQTVAGRKAREKERLRQREFNQTPEGEMKQREYFQRYKPKVYKRYNERYQSDPHFRIGVSLRKRLTLALKARRTQKVARLVELIGCTITELATHLEKKFQAGMAWANYGEWHIDHIRPCASFDLTDAQEQRRCFHYSNLQPLWAGENIRKADHFPADVQEGFDQP